MITAISLVSIIISYKEYKEKAIKKKIVFLVMISLRIYTLNFYIVRPC